jgi:outer membrane lipoprotein-sorting protein
MPYIDEVLMRLHVAWLFVFMFAVGCTSAVRAADLSAQSSVDDVLDALDARGQTLNGFTANVKLSESDAATGDATLRTGKIWYQAGENPRIRVLFEKRESNKKITDDKIEYLLSGRDLIDRTYSTKREVMRHILKPGEKMNLLKLGEGPFPLPIGQKKEDVHANFEVKKMEPAKSDPPGTVQILLSPKPATRLARRFKSINVWVDLKDHMPKKIETLDTNETTIRSTELTNVQINPTLTDADFTLPKVSADDWQLMEEAFND